MSPAQFCFLFASGTCFIYLFLSIFTSNSYYTPVTFVKNEYTIGTISDILGGYIFGKGPADTSVQDGINNSLAYKPTDISLNISGFNSTWSGQAQVQSTTQPTNAGQVEFLEEYSKLHCKFPILDPYDETIKPFLSHPQPLVCPHVQYDLTYVDMEGSLLFNASEHQKAMYMYGNLSCSYRYFDKLTANESLTRNLAIGDDEHIVTYIDNGHIFFFGDVIRMQYDTVEVKCRKTTANETVDPRSMHGDRNKEIIYWNIHAHPVVPVLQPVDASHQGHLQPPLSVLILGIDSISTSAFRRHLPLTYKYLVDHMKAHMFLGHHKIGDNSFPNQMAVLLGKRVVDEQTAPNQPMLDEVRQDYYHIFYDDWPLLWHTFSQKGYETSFNEDTPHWGLFHYFSKGFAKKPVHHYYHQFWLAVAKGDYKYLKYCFGNRPKIVMQVDLIKRQLVVSKSTGIPQFIYAFFTELFHQDEGYESEKADPYLYEFLRDMHENGHLDNTALLFMSDHGHRYASIRRTLVGLVEERLPMLNLWFPEWFYHKFPHVNSSLAMNTLRLTSHFDLHETLLDILRNDFTGEQRPNGSRGLSLLYPIQASRNCYEAGIPEHYCTCLSEENVAVEDPAVIKAAAAVLDRLNALLSNYSHLCAPMNLQKILRAERLFVHEKVAMGVSDAKGARTFDATRKSSPKRSMNKLRLTFETSPADALFEATVSFVSWESRWVVDGRVFRLNSYDRTL